jgi:magnesium-transporting ATPase (P-type)
LPHAIKTQWIYLLYRTVIAFYFLVWLLAIGINFSSPKLLIYLTQWSFLALNAYFISALITTVVNFFLAYVHPKKRRVESPPDAEIEESYERHCCKSSTDKTTFCDKITWALFLVGAESSFMVVLLFWILIGSSDNPPDINPSVNAHVHALNGVIAIVEVWITGIPVHLLQFVYPALFTTTYAVFTGVYYAANGTDPFGGRAIYPVILDYGSQPGVAVGTVVVSIVTILLIHLFFHAQYRLRHWLTARLQRRFRPYRRYFDHIDMSAPIPVLD